MTISYSDLISITQGKYHNFTIPDEPIGSISTDSRTLQKGQIFLALRGENFDGHQFVSQAFDRGAVLGILNQNIPDYPCLIVENTLYTYQQIARAWRRQANIPVIAVTGSAGKTTTKEMISSLLELYCPEGKIVHRSLANFNNDIGVAKTLLEIDPDRHSFVVIEMGMRGRGEIDRLASIALPNVAIITNIGTAHIGKLGSQEQIAEAKCEILKHLTGVAVLNGEDQLLLQTAQKNWHKKIITYGLDRGDIKGEITNDRLKISNLTWNLPLPGRHNALNFLAGIAVLSALNLPLEESTKLSIRLNLPQGRANIITLPNGAKLIDETYNASPEAVIASLHWLTSMPGRHWAVLGAMKELGDHSLTLHQEIGKTIDRLRLHGLIVLADQDTKEIIKVQTKTKTYTCQNQTEMLEILLQEIQTNDVILLKASRSIGLDQLVKQIIIAMK